MPAIRRRPRVDVADIGLGIGNHHGSVEVIGRGALPHRTRAQHDAEQEQAQQLARIQPDR